MVEQGIEPANSWLVVRDPDHISSCELYRDNLIKFSFLRQLLVRNWNLRLCVYAPELVALYVQEHHRHLILKGLTAIGPDSDDTANHTLKMDY